MKHFTAHAAHSAERLNIETTVSRDVDETFQNFSRFLIVSFRKPANKQSMFDYHSLRTSKYVGIRKYAVKW